MKIIFESKEEKDFFKSWFDSSQVKTGGTPDYYIKLAEQLKPISEAIKNSVISSEDILKKTEKKENGSEKNLTEEKEENNLKNGK